MSHLVTTSSHKEDFFFEVKGVINKEKHEFDLNLAEGTLRLAEG